MEKTPRTPWFGRKLFGIGLAPVSWQGWLTTLVFVALVAADTAYFKNDARGIAAFALLTAGLFVVIYLTMDRTPLK